MKMNMENEHMLRKEFAALQKELSAKNRELEIEASLEKVRARSFAMQSSDELLDASDTMFAELEKLSINPLRIGICTINAKTGAAEIWSPSQTNKWKESKILGIVPKGTHPVFDNMVKAWKGKKPFYSSTRDGTEVKEYYEKLAAHLSYPLPAKYNKEETITAFFFPEGFLNVISLKPLPKSGCAIMSRFAKVFGQIYTRFRDLQKAEAQAREAQIEYALEKVRSRTMAMYKSSELAEAARLLYKEFKTLNINTYLCGYCFIKVEQDKQTVWVTVPDGTLIPDFTDFPLEGHYVLNKRYEDWKQKKALHVLELQGEANKEFHRFLASKVTDPTVNEIFSQMPDRAIFYCANFSTGYLFIIATESLAREEEEVIIRFAKVFEQTYTRFLDLQKAEAQAREAKIETALEKVRSRTMAMQHSDELPEAANVLFLEVQALGIPAWSCGYNVLALDKKTSDCWMSSEGAIQEPFNLYFTEEDSFIEWYNFLQSEDSFFVQELGGQALEAHYNYMRNIPRLGEVLKKLEDAGISLPTYQINHLCKFTYGFLLFITYEPVRDAHDLFKRFTKVFEQTYTRFLDLQKAEAQARESQIEASLERVRSRSMGMQKSDELREVIHVIYEQFVHLNIQINTVGFILDYKERDDLHFWLANKFGPFEQQYPYFESPHWNLFIAAKQKGLDFFADTLTFDEKNKFFKKVFGFYPDSPKEAQDLFYSSPGWASSNVLLKNVCLFIDNLKGIPFADADNAILMRFGKVFEQTYIRFLDLQKAEAQAREAKIEAALERVRSRSMAMHKSDELLEVIKVIAEQLTQLGLAFDNVSFGINDQADDFKFWVAMAGQPEPLFIHVPYIDNPAPNRVKEAQKNGIKFFADILTKEENRQWTQHFINFSDIKLLPDNIKNYILNCEGYARSTFILNNINLYVGNYHAIAYSEVDNNIFKRFSQVFEQSYIRFLDLQKAEAQAREAEIELALERVRAKTMAMQLHDDLLAVTNLLAEQLIHLGFDLDVVNFSNGLSYGDWDIWITAPVSETTRATYRTAVTWIDHPYFQKIRIALDNFKKGIDLDVAVFNKEEKDGFLDHLLICDSFFKNIPVETRAYLYDKPGFTWSGIFLKETWVTICKYDTTPFTDEQHAILRRFVNAFGQAYTRFLDLQKAEAQAREAKIEASLERVRSKAMAMQKSEDLANAVAIVFEELDKLDLGMLRCGIGIINKENRSVKVWAATKSDLDKPVQVSGDESMDTHPLLQGAFNAWLKQEDYSHVLQGNNLTDYYKTQVSANFKLPDSHSLVTANEEVQQYYFLATFPAGGLFAFRETAFPEEAKVVMKRFADVFNLTYTRYNDLQLAEAQTREAKIEAALERVRGKAMGMHNSNDLSVTASMVFTELRKLGINPVRCGVSLQTKDSRKNLLYYAIPSAEGDNLSFAGAALLAGHPVLAEIYDSWVRGEDYFPVLKGDLLIKYYQTLKQVGFDVPVSPKGHEQYGYYLAFSEGMFYGWAEKPFTESEIKLIKRFASVIDLTFRRYMELQKSEASAREAVKQAALDRVRAEIASMRTIDDLERITPLIWNELTILGVAFIRCGVFIMDDANGIIHTFLSTPEGKAIAAFQIPYTTPGNIEKVLSHWQHKKNYIDHWDESDFTEFAGTLIKEGALLSPEEYLETIPRGGFYLHFLPFLQGMLYVGNTTQLDEEEIKLIKSVADAFSTAYARYEDFNKLEAAKQQVDKTLVDLKQAQTQLVQSEKMASLGELTAGIAHEIQNPLNFVNNFSEVSRELLDEMKEEIEKGNTEEVKAIALDVIQNLEKINHHGKRADEIVKGMLQHSRASTGQKEPTNINVLADEYLRLSYHGMRSKDKLFNATIQTDFEKNIGNMNIVPQDIGRVLLNLYNNAFYSVNERLRQAQPDSHYEPSVSVSTKKVNDKIEIRVEDNGNGIPQNIVDKIFQPFFTTKPTGQGTGLGLSLSYDIIKAHGGEIKVETEHGQGTTFIIELPISK